jgi:hypothetical protein
MASGLIHALRYWSFRPLAAHDYSTRRPAVTACQENVVACHENIMACHENVVACQENIMACHENIMACHENVMACHENVVACHENIMACREKVLANYKDGMSAYKTLPLGPQVRPRSSFFISNSSPFDLAPAFSYAGGTHRWRGYCPN